jgi:hypothetical protein
VLALAYLPPLGAITANVLDAWCAWKALLRHALNRSADGVTAI